MIEAKNCLADLKKAGLESITLSTDRYHLLAVPIESLRYALDAAGDMGLRTAVKISRLCLDPVAEGLYRSLKNNTTRVFVQEISPLGRATALRPAVKLKPATSFTGPGCQTPPVLLPDGHLLACCNLPAQDVRQTDYPFILGSASKEPLGSLLERRSRDPVLTALRFTGPGTLLALLAQKDAPFREAGRVPYHSGCDLCFHLFCRLRDKHPLYAALRDQPDTRHPSVGASL
jgi:hypothetical protein